MKTIFVPPAPRIAVDHAGEGELVLFLHGIGGNRRNWHPQLPAVSAHYHAAAWDARGYGESDDVDGPRAFEDFAADLLRVVDHFGVAKAHLVGLSMGGRIAAAFHAAHPDRVASLALCDTHMGFAHFSAEQRERFVALRRDPLLAGRTPAEIATTVANTLIGDPDNEVAFDALVDSLSRLRAESYIKTIEASVDLDQAANFDGISVPTVIIVGALDRLTPPKLARTIHARIPGSELHVIEGAGHLSNIEAPDEFNRILLAFLARAAGA